MAKEYVIYFNSRKIVLTSKFDSPFNNREGLFVYYQAPNEIPKLLDFFQSSIYPQSLYLMGTDVDTMMESFSSHFLKVMAAGGLVENKKGQYLLIKRNGIWDLPKGKAEGNENPCATAIREVEEECGFKKVTITKHLLNTYHTYQINEQFVLKQTFWYSMKVKGKAKTTPQLDEGITDAVWIYPCDLNEIITNTYESIKKVLGAAGLL
ncbi:MAG: NUDIX domain-containing protein [Bacteroidales bacterium]|jgi:8-oxo-dGTP pyrophosphatase MutT (NUDIX family)|nr:NUDIX domain-containing protein [Bacteroidales bacterium]MDD4384309.1 NUDIX domain-containing protein [Bacteroidales bacterium]